MIKTVLKVTINFYKLIAFTGIAIIIAWKILRKSKQQDITDLHDIIENSTELSNDILEEIREEVLQEFQEDIEEEIETNFNQSKMLPHHLTAPVSPLTAISNRLFTEPGFFENIHSFKKHQICKKSVITIVSGHPSNFERRQFIRETWAHPEMTLLFILGSPQKPGLWKYENTGDIIKLNFTENYDLLTVKTIASFNFIEKMCKINNDSESRPWMVHIDDDMYFKTASFIEQLQTLEKSKDRIYCLDKILQSKDGLGTKPHRGGKYKITYEEFAKDRFPIACSGTAFAVRRDLVHKMNPVFKSYPPIRLEDIYATGIIREAAGLPNPIALRPKVVEHFKGDDAKMLNSQQT